MEVVEDTLDPVHGTMEELIEEIRDREDREETIM